MKRSVMLEGLKEILVELQSHDDYEDFDKEFSTRADCILSFLEVRGMLPPSTYLEHLHTTDNGWDKDDRQKD